MVSDHSEQIGHVADAASGLIVLGVFAKILPVIAAILSIVWYTIRIIDYFESRKRK